MRRIATHSSPTDGLLRSRAGRDGIRTTGTRTPIIFWPGKPLDELPAAGGWLQLAIRDGDSGALLGDVGVHRLDEQPDTFELGITVAPDRQRLGIGAEALRAVIRWLFEQHAAHRVVASCDSRNSASQGLLAAVGFRHEGRAVDAEFVKGEWTSVEHYAMLAGDR